MIIYRLCYFFFDIFIIRFYIFVYFEDETSIGDVRRRRGRFVLYFGLGLIYFVFVERGVFGYIYFGKVEDLRRFFELFMFLFERFRVIIRWL